MIKLKKFTRFEFEENNNNCEQFPNAATQFGPSSSLTNLNLQLQSQPEIQDNNNVQYNFSANEGDQDKINVDNSNDSNPKVYISNPAGRRLQIIVCIVGLIQISLAAFGIYFWYKKIDAYKYFPQWGPIILDINTEFKYSGLAWFIVELVVGIWLVLIVYTKTKHWIFTAWIWSLLALTMASFVFFSWNIPFQYYKYGSDVLTKFSIQTLFHLIVLAIAREYYKRRSIQTE